MTPDEAMAALEAACGEAWKRAGPPDYTPECTKLMADASARAGSFYVYDVYDSCGDDQVTLSEQVAAFHQHDGLGGGLAGTSSSALREDPAVPCGKNRVSSLWLDLPQVSELLHCRCSLFIRSIPTPLLISHQLAHPHAGLQAFSLPLLSSHSPPLSCASFTLQPDPCASSSLIYPIIPAGSRVFPRTTQR